MPSLTVIVKTEAGVTFPANGRSFQVDAAYRRVVKGGSDASGGETAPTVQETLRATLDRTLSGRFELIDPAPDTAVNLHFLGANGSVRLSKTISRVSPPEDTVTLSEEEVKVIVAPDPQPPPSTSLVERRAYFVWVGEKGVPFQGYKLQISPLGVGNGGWSALGLDQIFHSEMPLTSSVWWTDLLPAALRARSWTPFHLAVDGKFSFHLPLGSGDAWMWWLTGSNAALGIVLDDLSAARVARIPVALPPFLGGETPDEGFTGIPSDVTESEVASNPDVYSEDPGEFCRPFKNPERVLAERRFFVVLRAEQPVVSAEPSVQTDPTPGFAFDPRALTGDLSGATFDPMRARTVPGAVLDDDGGRTNVVRHALPSAYLDILRNYDRGRKILDPKNPMQWEGDISRYQAATVARGHILEFRMRSRSNGYSLGTVAKTLTLAPRQIKRIQKVEWRRSELSRRQEATQLADRVSDTLSRERDYDDSVRATLSEWARGESESSMASGAGGFGITFGFGVLGGGGGYSTASSSSEQEGGRATSASEEQRLRDSIRRYGDSLRKLDSLVVNEVTQEETAVGTTEIIRNFNYEHSLTVIYYQILRHLKIETGVAGVRECLFVPFAIAPFTVARAYRWRDFLLRGLRDPQYAGAIKYLKDVDTNFAASDIPPGRRSDQPARAIYGSLSLKLAIARPKDKDDGSFDAAAWVALHPYLGSPARSIFDYIKAVEKAERDAEAAFQKEHAPTIAANWVDTLQIEIGGAPVTADFTLATQYRFNGVVRVDFSISAPSGVTRETLAAIRVTATQDLTPGSVANAVGMTFTYQTDQFERTVAARHGADDLIKVETGVRDPLGAAVNTIPDTWERRDIRGEMVRAVQSLLEHLNQHVEYYHKIIWWSMDRDRLFMLMDGFHAPGTSGVSVASVVEREPLAIIGNCMVFRVSAGAFLGLGDIKTPKQLLDYYRSMDAVSEPMLVSLPTDGLYAQTVMDECAAVEEHFGNTDWVLNDPDPELGSIAPELLGSRRAEPQGTQPTPFPQTIINLQNAPEAPAPSGLAGALSAVTNANAFRDMAGLAGTQANAATAFQTAASLASNFGAQAAALKLAEIAAKAQATQATDQKLASVQRAFDKGQVPLDVAQAHASKILNELHTPTTPPRPHQDPALSQAIFAASGQPGSTIESSSAEGIVRVALSDNAPGGAPGGQPAAVTPAVPLPTRIAGIDMYQQNTGFPSFSEIARAGFAFVFHKASQFVADTKFAARWPQIAQAGMMRGAYHFFSHNAGTVPQQAERFANTVVRLVPGDLGPSLDLEDRDQNHHAAFWVPRIHELADLVEARLGRQPILYTSRSYWHEFTNDNQEFGQYPLWVVWVNAGAPQLPVGWANWHFWQWHWEQSTSPMPPPFAASDRGIDLNHFNGTIYELRGMADLGHTAPHVVGNQECIAYTETDGKIHLLEFVAGAWQDQDLSGAIPSAPLAAGDPAAVGIGSEQILLYRAVDGDIYALTRSLTDVSGAWSVSATGPFAVDDPFATSSNSDLHCVFWNRFDQQIHLSRTAAGVWSAEHAADLGAVPPPLKAAGSAVMFFHQNALHVVSRAGIDGHLIDLVNDGANRTQDDLTATADDGGGQAPPAATYRPATYTPAGGAPRIVFRAVRGEIWQIQRDTLVALNLSVGAGNAPPSAGSPSAVFAAQAHILYRTMDGMVIDIFDDAGVWRHRGVCADAAADPTAFLDSVGHAAVSFRAANGAIRVARFVNGVWKCEDALPPRSGAVADAGAIA